MSRYNARGGNNQNSNGTPILLNVYDLSDNNQFLVPFGLGAHHSGVQIGSREYTYAGGSGVYATEPLNAPGAIFRETVELGRWKGTSSQLETVLHGLRLEFPPDGYNILTRNCNSFAEQFVIKLTNGQGSVPGYVNRLASIGQMFSCCLPPELTNSSGPGGTSNNNDNNQGQSNYSGGGSVFRQNQNRTNTASSSTTPKFQGSGFKLGGGSSGSGGNPYKQVPVNNNNNNGNSSVNSGLRPMQINQS